MADRLVSTRRHWERVSVPDRRARDQGRDVASMSKKFTEEEKAAALAKWKAYLDRAYHIRQGLEEPEPIRIFRYMRGGRTEDVV